MHYIEQTCETSTTIIGKAYNEKHLLNKIIIYAKSNYPKYQVLKSITQDTLKTGTNYDDGVYLLCNDNCIQLVTKNKIVSQGYIYNSIYPETKILYTWKLIRMGDFITANKTESKTEIRDENINLTELPVEKLAKANIIVISGKTGTDVNLELKNVIAILSKNGNIYDENILTVSSLLCTQSYYKSLSSQNIIQTLDYDVIKKHIADGKGFIIFDDCFENKNIHEIPDEIFQSKIPLIFVFRSNTTVWIESDLNIHADYILQKFECYQYKLQRIWKTVEQAIPNFDIFKRVFNMYTRNYQSIVIDNKATDIKLYCMKSNE